jgi:uncharacterized LabA/DUF88 family protein
VGKNVAVFVDVANIFYAAKAAGVDIDYVTLLKTATAGRDLVRAYAYTGLDPDNDNQRNFHEFLRRHGYKVVVKDIRKYGDGKVKANLDIELVVDMMKTARNLDIAIVISGDGDFAPAIRAVQEMGVRVEVISFRGNTSSDLIEVADLFTEITQVARVEKGSSRSGRRVADDEEDLSMTEVPDKQSDGTGVRGRGRGRGRARPVETEVPVAAAPAAAPRSRSRARPVEAVAAPIAAVTSSGIPLTVLPGEKLSRVVVPTAPVAGPPAAAPEELEELEELDEGIAGEAPSGIPGEEPRRRRRRRGGRGRGRGRGHEGVETTADGEPVIELDDEAEAEAPVVARRTPRAPRVEPDGAPAKRVAQTFGSVWEAQIGIPTPSSGGGTPLDEEDLDEPPIPEYLISERKQREGGRGGPASGGPRGGRSSGGARAGYAAAIDRERYGGGRGSTPSRFAEPAPRGGGGGREPERFRSAQPDRPDRAERPTPRFASRPGSSEEPWSEVPPEIEAMLRAQLGAKAQRPAGGAAPARPASAEAERSEEAALAPKRRVTRRPAAAASEPATTSVPAPRAEEAVVAPKRRAPRKVAADATADLPAAASAEVGVPSAAPKIRAARKPATEAAAPVAETADVAAPKRRAPRKQAPAADA